MHLFMFSLQCLLLFFYYIIFITLAYANVLFVNAWMDNTFPNKTLLPDATYSRVLTDIFGKIYDVSAYDSQRSHPSLNLGVKLSNLQLVLLF